MADRVASNDGFWYDCTLSGDDRGGGVVTIRKSNMDFEHWDAFNEAVRKLIKNNEYEKLVDIHRAMEKYPDGLELSKHRMHGTFGPRGYRRFLPWHRAYLLVFEKKLQEIDPELSIPYWDWESDKGQLKGFDKPIHGVNRTPEYERRSWFPTIADELDALYGMSLYGAFTQRLEDVLHNWGHWWIGGDMNSMSSPKDVAFWLHHAAVDRVWAKWQEKNPDELASLSDNDAKLDPWDNKYTVENVNNIKNLGYDYQ